MLRENIDFGTPNWLAKAHRVTATRTAESTGSYVADVNGRKIAGSGRVWPSNDENAQGIIIDAVDVTDGPKPVAIMLEGYVHEERLPEKISAEAKTALKEIKFEKYNAKEA